MNNLFGLSEDTMKAIFVEALKRIQQQEQTTGSFKTESQIDIDIDVAANANAELTKKYYDAYVKVGFTDAQAFELLKTILLRTQKKG
jgi:hypothetical protein